MTSRSVGLVAGDRSLSTPPHRPLRAPFPVPRLCNVQVSFTSEFVEEPSLLIPAWNGNNCDACVEFSSGFPRGGGAYVNVSSKSLMGEWEEQAVLQASDRRSGDRFGASLALDQARNVTNTTVLPCLLASFL